MLAPIFRRFSPILDSVLQSGENQMTVPVSFHELRIESIVLLCYESPLDPQDIANRVELLPRTYAQNGRYQK